MERASITITMETEEILIEVYDERVDMTSSIYVSRISENVFRMTENDIFNCRLTFGTEFETKINENGKCEIVRIIKESTFVTRRFMLTKQFAESNHTLFGEEIVKNGGFWQLDFGGMTTINLPKDTALNIDALFKLFNCNPTEIKE